MKPFTRRTHRQRCFKNLNPYIYRVLMQVHYNTSISRKAISIINSMLMELMCKLVAESKQLTISNQKGTLSSREVQAAVRSNFPRDLAKFAIRESANAVHRFGNPAICKGPLSRRANLVFPVPYLLKELRVRSRVRVTTLASVYLAATLEYFSAELLELSGNSARLHGSRINPNDILLAIRSDDQLNDIIKALGSNPIGF